MREEDEYTTPETAKSGAEKVLELTVAESGARKEVAKRNTSVKNSFADLEKSLSAYLKSYIDDPKTEQRKLDLEEDKPSIEVK